MIKEINELKNDFKNDFKMDEYKAHLASLSTRELESLADQWGIDIVPALDRQLIIRELLDNAFTEALGYDPYWDLAGDEAGDEAIEEKPEVFAGKAESRTVALPKQYQINYLEALVRDPQWVYIFWELKTQDRERYEAEPQFKGYALRAFEQKNGTWVESFTTPVGAKDNSWYLGFPDGGNFCIGLWIRGIEVCPVMSTPFELPRFINSPGNKEFLDLPLNRLSGAADFALLRDTGRLSRFSK